MGKSGREATSKKAGPAKVEAEHQKVLPMAEVLVNVQDGLRDLVIGTGLQVLEAMLEEDRKELCGPARKKQADRQAYRHGFDRGHLVLGGRKISVRKPRVRSVQGEEVPLPSWETLADEDPLDVGSVTALPGDDLEPAQRPVAEPGVQIGQPLHLGTV